jgi:hypothetical protein
MRRQIKGKMVTERIPAARNSLSESIQAYMLRLKNGIRSIWASLWIILDQLSALSHILEFCKWPVWAGLQECDRSKTWKRTWSVRSKTKKKLEKFPAFCEVVEIQIAARTRTQGTSQHHTKRCDSALGLSRDNNLMIRRCDLELLDMMLTPQSELVLGGPSNNNFNRIANLEFIAGLLHTTWTLIYSM